MDTAYLIYMGAVVVGVAILMGVMYFMYRRGIAIRLTLIMLGSMVPPAIVSFYLGKEGITILSVSVVVVALLPLIIGLLITMVRQVVNPLRQLTSASEIVEKDLRNFVFEMNSLSQGDLTRGMTITAQAITIESGDEIGQLAGTFNAMVLRLQETGNAFSQMIGSLRILVGQVAGTANDLGEAARQLAAASEQSDAATRQIATTIQQVAEGIAQQTFGVTKTSTSVEQMKRAIDGVARGAQEQAVAINKASQVAARINASIEQVTRNIQTVTQDSAQSATYSRDGAQTVNDTITGMGVIHQTVEISAVKVKEMGARSEEIGNIVETIEDIASQTNLLAFNAAIEAARASGSGAKVNEQLLQQHLLGIADLLAELCVRSRCELTMEDLKSLAKRARVDMLNITDDDGVVVLSNIKESLGFRLPEDPNEQAAAFRPLLRQKDGAMAQPARPRSQDGVLFIFAGVSRRDQPGVVQAGVSAAIIERSGDYTRGFAVVADEVRKLAERSSNATKEIASLIKNIQKKISEAVDAMTTSASEVEAGVMRANSAGEVLDNIMKSAESVHKHAEEAGNAAAKVSKAAMELVEAVDVVSAVTEENTAATEQMAVNSSELTESIENIASVSEESSASVQQVSASTEEVSAQVGQVSASAASLMGMAQQLTQVVSRFKLRI